MTWRNATRELPTTSIPGPLKHTRSVSHAEDVDCVGGDGDGAEYTSGAESESESVDDIEDTDFLTAQNSFDNSEAMEALREETSTNILENLVTSPCVPHSILDSNIEYDATNMEMFTEQCSRLKKLCESLANRFELDDPNDVLREEVLQELALVRCTNE